MFLNSLKESLNFKDKTVLKKIIELHDQGLTLGEIAFDPDVWASKEISYWSLDTIINRASENKKFSVKKQKYIDDIQARDKNPIENASEVIEQLRNAKDLKELEHHFRPYKKKKKTKATIAREAGLQDFANLISKSAAGETAFENGIETEAKKYIQPALGFITYEHVLKGVQDILVEQGLKDHNNLREKVLKHIQAHGKISVQPGEKHSEKSRYTGFLKAPSHGYKYYINPKNYDKFPAIKKGWEDNHLKVTLDFDTSVLIKDYENAFVPEDAKGDVADLMREAAKKAFEIHVLPSVSTEVFDSFYETSKAVYLDRLKKDYISLLLTPALGAKPVLSVYEKNETQCFLVFTSHNGEFISSTIVNPESDTIVEDLKSVLKDIVKSIKLGCVALPLSLKTRKIEKFFVKSLEDLNKKEEIPIVYVSNRGLAQFVNSSDAKFGFGEEKIDNIALSAFRLAKRVQDPIYEYAEHSPQYLLDAPGFIEKEELEEELFKTLSFFMCTIGLVSNKVGTGLVKNLNWFKEDYSSEDELKNLVEKINSSKVVEKKSLETILKNSFERYSKYFCFKEALNVLDQARLPVQDFSKIKDFCKDSDISLLKGPVENIQTTVDKENIDSKWEKIFGKNYFRYLCAELSSPFRDPRKPYKVFGFSKNTDDIESIKEGQLCWGVVTKFSPFGVFVDIGVGTDGLVHLSELSDEFIADPRKALKLDQWVLVKVLKVDQTAKQLSFSKTKAQESFKSKPNFKSKDKKKSFDKKFDKKNKPFSKKEGSKNEGRGQKGQGGQKPYTPKKPFNNPFAALGDLTKDQ